MSAGNHLTHRRSAIVAVTLSVVVFAMTTAPTLAESSSALAPGTPVARFLLRGTLDTKMVPIVVSWPAATPTDAVERYELETSADVGPWLPVNLTTPLARKAKLTLSPGSTNRFRVRAIDKVGMAGPWSTASEVWLSATPEDSPALTTIPSWRLRDVASAYGGALSSANESSATVTFLSTGTHMAWVSERGPKRGRAAVYVDGVFQSMLDLWRPTREPRQVVYQGRWKTAEPRRIQIRVEGTAGRPRVDLDAILALEPPRSAVSVGAGDIADCTVEDDSATAALVESIAGTVFTLGDNVYSSGTDEEFAQCYEPTWGRFKARTRPTPGNHDHRSDPAAGPYYRYFGGAAGTPGQGWYSYDAATWRVYALNSECQEVGGCEPGSAQYEWLRQELSSEPRACTLAYWHEPRLSSGSHGESTVMVSILGLLHEAGAEVILNGHEHSYERFAPSTPDGAADDERGMRQFVVGTGGVALRPFTAPPAPLTVVRDATSHGVLQLTLDPGSYAWQFLPVPGAGFTDAGSASCH